MTTANRLLYRADDIWEMPDDGNRYEVIDGELFVTPPPGMAHQDANANLNAVVDQHERAHRLGPVYFPPANRRDSG